MRHRSISSFTQLAPARSAASSGRTAVGPVMALDRERLADLRELVNRSGPGLIEILTMILGYRPLAENAAADTLVTMGRKSVRSADVQDEMRLLQTAVDIGRHYDRRRSNGGGMFIICDRRISPAPVQSAQQMRDCLRSLSYDERTAIVLYYAGNLSVEEISKVMRKRIDYAERCLRAARARLQTQINRS